MLHYNMGKVNGFIYKNQESHIYFNCTNFVFIKPVKIRLKR